MQEHHTYCRLRVAPPPSIAGSFSLSRAAFGVGSGPIFLDDLGCIGNETRLERCRHDGIAFHNCQHTEDASVVCEGEGTFLPPIVIY